MPFSLSTDGSSDRGADEQLYPIVVRYFDVEVQRVISVLLPIATTKERSTGQNIFILLDNVLKENGIPRTKVVCFRAAADNAAVMMGAVPFQKNYSLRLTTPSKNLRSGTRTSSRFRLYAVLKIMQS